MRTVDATMLAALGSTTRVPAIQMQVSDLVQHFNTWQTPNTADQWSDACIANDGSIIRVTITRGGTNFDRAFQWQRITDPTQPAQWSTWNTFGAGSNNIFEDGGCAVSNNSGTLRAFAQQGTPAGSNAIWGWTSTDNGNSWSAGPGVVLSPPLQALTKGIGSGGNNDVFFLYDVSGGEKVGASFYTGTWSALNTAPFPVIANGAGIGVAWSAANSIFYLAYSDGSSIYNGIFNQPITTWSQQPIIAAATSTAINRFSPRMAIFDGLYVCTCIESDTGVLTGTAYQYPRIRKSQDSLHWSNGEIVHGINSFYGAVTLKSAAPQFGTAGPRYYVMSTPTVYSAVAFVQSNPNNFVDVSASVLSYKREEHGERPAELEVVLDNAGGAYNALVYLGLLNYRPISPNATIALSEGYKVGGTPDLQPTGTYHINRITFERTPETNQLRLIAYDRSRDLDRQCRWQMTYSGQTVAWLVTEVVARAGAILSSVPATSNTGQTIATWILHAGQTYRASLNELCNTYGLWYFCDQNETIQFRELAATDAIVWRYQPEWEALSIGQQDMAGNHIIVSGKPPTGGSAYAITDGEAYDDANTALVQVERVIHHIDQKLTTSAQCVARANSLLLQEQRLQQEHTIIVPANPALQLYDGIAITDYTTPQGTAQVLSATRIIQSVVLYEAEHGIYDHHLALEGL